MLLSALHVAGSSSFFRLSWSVTSTEGSFQKHFKQVSVYFTDPSYFLFITQHNALFYFIF